MAEQQDMHVNMHTFCGNCISKAKLSAAPVKSTSALLSTLAPANDLPSATGRQGASSRCFDAVQRGKHS